jgi:hypothetical protein
MLLTMLVALVLPGCSSNPTANNLPGDNDDIRDANVVVDEYQEGSDDGALATPAWDDEEAPGL